ncbi:MAG TPA: tail fiber protein [Noviherbaspirillum sp.]|nr:tail fiber protein [Noviherbaspirillum sp.]
MALTKIPYAMTETDVAAAIAAAAAAAFPTGVMVPYAGSIAPSGFLLCDGSAVSRSTYASLFAAIGTLHGSGDGATTFNLPDMRGRVAVAPDNMGGTAANRTQIATTITTTAGSATATVGSTTVLFPGMYVNAATVPAGTTIATISTGNTITLSTGTGVTAGTNTAARFSILSDAQVIGASGGSHNHTLSLAQMPAHTHGNAAATFSSATAGAGFYAGAAGAQTTSAGSGQAHPNMQPSLVVNHIIKV